MRTLITNGTIVTAEGSTAADVLIDGETIAAIGAGLAATGVTADETIDAAGKYVIPGGIDVHTHMELPFGGTFAKDTFETGTRAAAFGGTTTVVDFAVQSRGKSLREGLDAWHAKAEGNAVADYGFHMIMSDVNDDTLAEMDGLVAEGVPDFKLFTAYPDVFYSDDGAIFRAMQQTAKNGGLIMMHAENGMAIDVVAAQTVAAGTTDPIGHGARPQGGLRGRGDQPGHPPRRGRRRPRLHRPPVGLGRPRRGARRARSRDDGLRRDVPAVPVPLARRPRATASTAPSSCARRRSGRRRRGTTSGAASSRTISSSSRPTTARSTSTARRSSGVGDFRKIPNGLPGVEDRVDLLHDGGVVAGRISRERWVEIISTAPAKLFGMYPRKGAVAVGSDADLVVYDPNRRHTISATTHHMDVDYSCYEGRSVQGGSDVVLSRGSVIVRNGEFTGRKGAGRFIKRATGGRSRAQTRRGTRPRRAAAMPAATRTIAIDRPPDAGVRVLRGPGQRPALASARQGDLGDRSGRRRLEDPPGRRGARRPRHRRRHRGDRLRAAVALRLPGRRRSGTAGRRVPDRPVGDRERGDVLAPGRARRPQEPADGRRRPELDGRRDGRPSTRRSGSKANVTIRLAVVAQPGPAGVDADFGDAHRAGGGAGSRGRRSWIHVS